MHWCLDIWNFFPVLNRIFRSLIFLHIHIVWQDIQVLTRHMVILRHKIQHIKVTTTQYRGVKGKRINTDTMIWLKKIRLVHRHWMIVCWCQWCSQGASIRMWARSAFPWHLSFKKSLSILSSWGYDPGPPYSSLAPSEYVWTSPP